MDISYVKTLSQLFDSVSEYSNQPKRGEDESHKAYVKRIKLFMATFINSQAFDLLHRIDNESGHEMGVSPRELILFFEDMAFSQDNFEYEYSEYCHQGFSGFDKLAIKGLFEKEQPSLKLNILLSPWEALGENKVYSRLTDSPEITQPRAIDLSKLALMNKEETRQILSDIHSANKKGATFLFHGASGNRFLLDELKIISANNY